MKKLWKIYYGDGTTFSSEDGHAAEAPGLNAQAIVQLDDAHGWSTISGTDFYIWDDRGSGAKWWAVDREGLSEYLFIYTGLKVALLGRFLEDPDFDEILKRAKNDPDFPPKTGYRAHERK